MDEQVELRIEPRSGRFVPHDDRWLDQVGGLIGELRTEVGGVSTERTAVPGKKGAIDAIVLSLASAGGLTALTDLVRSWLTRDRTRSLKVSWSDSGAVESIEVSGSEIDDAAFDDLVRSVSQRLAGEA
jgi:hypothetical protein